MSWAVHREWGRHLDAVKLELRDVISAIAMHEPVKLLTPSNLISEARNQFRGRDVEIIPAPVDDIWMRDILPSFAFCGHSLLLIDWNFNGWGSSPARRARAGDRLGEVLSSLTQLPMIAAPFVAEGGAILTDGQGTIVTTKSCLLNPNRNPGRNGSEIEEAFSKLGSRQLVWLVGDPDEPITSGHPDGYVLFSESGAILVEHADERHRTFRRRAQDIRKLRLTRDNEGRLAKLKLVLPPRRKYWRGAGRLFAPCYLNAYVTNGSVVTGTFGDAERDELARSALQEAFPGREIHMLRIDHIAAGGGGIHCLTQPQPATSVISSSQGHR